MTFPARVARLAGWLSLGWLALATAGAQDVEVTWKAAAVKPTAAPAAPARAKGVVPLPFADRDRALAVARTGVLRTICSRSYVGVVDNNIVRCNEGMPVRGDEPLRWLFRKPGVGKPYRTVEVVFERSPVRGFEAYLLAEARDDKDAPAPNDDLDAIDAGFMGLLNELAAAPLDAERDNIVPYQLSYVQADRAIAVLRTLGYPVIEYKKSATGGAGYDSIFEQLPAAQVGLLGRPLVIKLVDAEETSLVAAQTKLGDPELEGGQPLESVPDSGPPQRLLIVYDKNDTDSLDRLIEHLEREVDVPAKQILIEALVIELNHDRLLDLGVDFKGKKDNLDLSFEQSSGGLVQPFIFNFTQPTPRTLLEIAAKVRTLEDNGQATVLSRPSVFVLDGRQARIKVGDNVPYTSKVTVGNGGTLVSETSYIKSGIILNLRPRASADNSDVTLQVEAIISSPGPSRILPDIGALLAPTLQSRQIQTLVRVDNDTPFVIGGLIAHDDQESISGLPWLSTRRFIGALFRKQNLRRERREVIVVITPHVVAADDPTYANTIPRDTGPADSRRASGRTPFHLAGSPAPTCEGKVKDKLFDPQVSTPVQQGSLFDSLDPELFRSVYRLRGSDIFDLEFITSAREVTAAREQSRELAEELSPGIFDSTPRVDPPTLAKEVRARLWNASEGFVADMLTFFDGGVPGEQILVQNMIIRILERLGFGSCVSPDHIIFFPNKAQLAGPLHERELDPRFLAAEAEVRACLENGTVVLAFPPQKPFTSIPPAAGNASTQGKGDATSESDDTFLRQCLGLGDVPMETIVIRDKPQDTLKAADAEGHRSDAERAFSPPLATMRCVPLQGDDYITHLRSCNKNGWQTILLDREYEQRGRNTIGLLQSVLSLERLLELNDSHTFPLTLKGFHVGREMVLPAREDLRARRHLIDRQTAKRFYETLDYYHAFAEEFERRRAAFDPEVKRQLTLATVAQWVPGAGNADASKSTSTRRKAAAPGKPARVP